jgi:hypothetical protein
MPDLSIRISELKNRALGRLSDLHDDYFHTNQLWIKRLDDQRRGAVFTATNAKTGIMTTNPTEWLGQARASQQRLRIRTFKDLSSHCELFLDQLLRAWLSAFPDIVNGKTVTLETVRSSNDLAAVQKAAIEQAVESKLLDLLKGRPAGWFTFLNTHLETRVDPADASAFSERKAARDVLEHHNGVVDASYAVKAGSAAVFQTGDFFDPDDRTIDGLYDLVKRLIVQVSTDAELQSRTT